MAVKRSERVAGERIGPRLAELLAHAVIVTRRHLAPVEAQIRAAGTQRVIDRMGHEMAEHYRPLLEPLLAGEYGDLHPDVAAFLADAASGTDQWKSAGAFIFGSIQSSLGTVINNAVAPAAYALTRPSPNLRLDPYTVSGLVARGILDYGLAVEDAASQGIDSGKLGTLIEAQTLPPDPSVLAELINRELISEADAERWMTRSAIPAQLRGPLTQLRRLLLSPAEAGLAVLRGNMSQAEGAQIAGWSGMHATDFQTVIDNTGEPLGLMQLLEAYRRGIIDESRLERGIRQSRVRDEWIPAAVALRYEPMSTADAADAALRGHLTESAAQVIAEQNGLRPSDWAAYFANQGNPPGDMQLLELWRRGFIDESRVDLGLREGRLRDEWIHDLKHLSTVRLPTADAADAWLRGHLDHAAAETIMRQNGLAPEDIPLVFGNAGNPLALEQLLEAYRRDFIDHDTFVKGFKESRYRDEWAGTALELRYHPISEAVAIEAAVQNQTTIENARRISEQNGLLPDQFDIALRTAGEPPSRDQLFELFNRGIIGDAELTQGLRESRLKDKYIGVIERLRVRQPQEFQIQRLLILGVIDHETGIRLLMELGYSRELAVAFVTEAEVTATGEHRHLMAREITQLYENRIIGRDEAISLLTGIHFTRETAELMCDLADHQRDQKILNTGIAGVRKLYLAHRIGDTEAKADLLALNLGSDGADLYMRVWHIERKSTVKTLTEAQIIKAYKLNLFDPKDAKKNREMCCARLSQLGYDDTDATLLIEGA